MQFGQFGNGKRRSLARGAATAALLLAGIAVALPGQAKPGHHGKHGFRDAGSFMLRHAEEIGVDEATRAEIQAIVDAAREEGKALHEEQRRAHEAMRELLDQAEPDADAVMRQAETIGAIDVRQQKHQLETLLAVRAKLTPEQRAALEARKEEMREQHGKHGRHGKGCSEHADPEGESETAL